jgi:cell division septum initiation protein DivIVA
LNQTIERLLPEAKALMGYDQEQVKGALLNMEIQFMEKRGRLLQELEDARKRNEELREQLKWLEKLPLTKQLENELSSLFMTRFLEDTEEINQLIVELDQMEQPYHEMVQRKRQQKEQVKSRVTEATEFIKSFQRDF